MSEISAALEAIAREAGRDLRERFGRPRTVTKKGAIDLVTDADQAAEALILGRLAARFPGAPVLAEESGERAGEGGGAIRFVVDPLDGTTNYAHRVPHFATTIAAEDAQGLVAGVTYDPLRDELYVAARGEGAWCRSAAGDERLRLEGTVALDDAVLATGLPYDVRESGAALLELFGTFVTRSRAVRRFGSAALDLAWVAHGRYDGYWERGLKPWDLAAGLLLVREAGGACTDYVGGEPAVRGGECVAAVASLVPELVAITRPWAQRRSSPSAGAR